MSPFKSVRAWLREIKETNNKNKASKKTLDYMPDTSAAILMQTPTGGRLLIYLSAATVILFFAWAYFAHIDVRVRGSGTVVPASRVQVIQNFEGGIISDIMVSEGQHVEQFQPLIKLDNTRFQTSYRENEAEYNSLLATVQRLDAEINKHPLTFDGLENLRETDINREKVLFQNRQDVLNNECSIAHDRFNQVSQQLKEMYSRQQHLTSNLQLAKKELQLTCPLFKEGAVSEVDLLRQEQRVNEMTGDLAAATLAIPRLQSAIDEAQRKEREISLQFHQKAINEQKMVLVRLAQLNEKLKASQDRVDRTLVRSPVKGTIKKIHVNTLGGVVQPGRDLLEIVPYQDQLLIEAKVQPKDIAFLRPSLPAVVKISAYDFTTHGGLKGVVEHISADTIQEDGIKGRQSYYIVRVRTEKNNLDNPDKPIIPGMMTSVDIITSKRSVLASLLKPVLRAKEQALRER